MALTGEIIEVNLLCESEKKDMFSLMGEFYDYMTKSAFLSDLSEKDYCILLFNEAGDIKGFSTQKLMQIKLDGESINGVFSGDTIIHTDCWGSFELYKVFSGHFITYGRQFKDFYWFLISKGYKTYKMLPLFFHEFYPNFRAKTPNYEQSIMHAFGKIKYPGEYDEKSGVVCYRGVKDALKTGVADITEKLLKDRDISYFTRVNPGYVRGNDIVCLASLKEDNIKKTAQRLFLGG